MVIVIGSSGFVGRNLAEYFCNTKINFKPLRLRLREDFPVFIADAIVHLSGKAHDLANVDNPAEYYEINTELTKKVYDTFLLSKAKVFIILSSVKAVADSVSGVLTESAKPDPKTHYGKSKLLAEEYIITRPMPDDKRVYILRPCMIHGPGNKGNLNLLYKFVSKGLPYPLASFENKRSFLSVENLCFIIKELILRADVPSGIYNVADDEPLYTKDVVSLISKAINKPPRLLYIPQKVIFFLAKISDKLKLPLNTERLSKLTEDYIVSNQKIKNALALDHLPVSSREGLLKTILSFAHR